MTAVFACVCVCVGGGGVGDNWRKSELEGDTPVLY